MLAVVAMVCVAGGCATGDRQVPPPAEAPAAPQPGTVLDLALWESEPLVRTRVIYTMESLRLTPTGQWMTGDMALPGGETVTLAPSGGNVVLADGAGNVLIDQPLLILTPGDSGATILAEKVPYGIGWWWAAEQDRVYTGILEVRATEDEKLDVVVVLPIEEYLRGVVPSEIGGDAHPEALKSQAVAARSETVVALRTRKYAGPHYDLCADVECQAFSGLSKVTAAADEAIRATRGQVLTYEGEPIGAYYASNCGGYAEAAHVVWPDRTKPVPYWSANPDLMDDSRPVLDTDKAVAEWLDANPPAWCNPDLHPGLPSWSKRNFRWEREIETAQITAALERRGTPVGRVLELRSGERGESGRLKTLIVVGEQGQAEVGPELAIRQLVDPPLRSACFVVSPGSAPDKLMVRGAGWGHGVGMCQTGAIARAQAGQDYATILAHYYRETRLMKAYR
jgi:SpoIID/LytB domain protein